MRKEKYGVSVVICCYNSAERLPITLKHLQLQNVPSHIPWEIIIINNASTDNTIEIAKIHCESFSNLSNRYIIKNEYNPGLTYARRKGINIAKFEYIIFCDDDNWLEKNYVQTAYETMQSHQSAGAAGGIGFPIYNSKPPVWLEKYAMYYATGSQGVNNDESIEDITETKAYIYGAGAIFRKSLIINLINKNILSDRIGNSLISGGDNELCYTLIIKGHKILYNPKLIFSHFIPSNRLTWDYFKKLNEGFGFSCFLLIPYIRRLQNRNRIPFKENWIWLLSSSFFFFLRYECYDILLGKLKKNKDSEIKLAWRIGNLKAAVQTKKYIKSNFKQVQSL